MTINDGFEPNQNPVPAPQFDRTKIGSNVTLPRIITAHFFLELLMAGRVVDGRAGGVLLGQSFDDGGVRTIFKVGSKYLVEGLIEGGCFLVNAQASAMHHNRLKRMNAGVTLRERVEERLNDPCEQLIVSVAYPHDRLVWIDWSQIIVTREPAMKHVHELSDLNRSPNPYLQGCDHYRLFGCDGTADDVV